MDNLGKLSYEKTCLKSLDKLPKDRVLTLSYEKFCEMPELYLERMLDFIGADSPPDWITEATKIVNPSPNSWLGLSDEEQTILEQACKPGFALLCS